MDVESATFETKDETARKLLKQIEDLHTYVERNPAFIPNYGEGYRNGERIASGFVESAVNQVVSKRMVKHQQMQWTPRGAHLLLQIRTHVLNEEWEEIFRRWYPGFRPLTEEQPVKEEACLIPGIECSHWLQGAVRIPGPGSPPPPDSPFRGDGASDCGMDRAATAGGVALGPR